MARLRPIVFAALYFVGIVAQTLCPDKTKPNTDPAAQCDCGTTKCNPNQYCDQPNNACSDDPFCPEDKTTQVMVASCKCNTQTCKKTDYCDIAASGNCIPACPTDRATKITEKECGCGQVPLFISK